MDAGSRGNPCRGFFNMVSVFGFGVPYKCDALYFGDQLRTPKKRKELNMQAVLIITLEHHN